MRANRKIAGPESCMDSKGTREMQCRW